MRLVQQHGLRGLDVARAARLVAAVVLAVGCGGDDDADSGLSGQGTAATSAPGSGSGAADSTSTGPDDLPGTTAAEEPASTSDGAGASGSSTGDPDTGEVVWLRNDSWRPADGLTWQAWPGPTDCWASTFEPDFAPFEVVAAEVAIGGDASVATFDIAVWSVDGDGAPDESQGAAQVEVEGEAASIPQIDLESILGLPTFEAGAFAIVMCHVDHMGAPSIGTDNDGDVDGTRNWVLQSAMGQWVPAPDFFGISGDFILRAGVRATR